MPIKELISPVQAEHLMLGVIVVALAIGAAWGALHKRLPLGIGLGAAFGAGNYVMWRVYNAITDRLGLDTVKNLAVNLVLFIVVGIAAGLLWSRFAPSQPDDALDR